MKIGILGGTFDPVHFGHLRSALEVKEGLGLAKVLFVPSYMPPHKSGHTLTPFSLRVELLKIATRGEEAFELVDIEKDLPTPSYTVNTLAALRDRYGNAADFHFLLGSDAFFDLVTWHDYTRIMEHTKLVVMIRDQNSADDIVSFSKRHFTDEFQSNAIIPFEVTNIAISSSRIRAILSQGRSTRYLLPFDCIKFMEEQGLTYEKH